MVEKVIGPIKKFTDENDLLNAKFEDFKNNIVSKCVDKIEKELLKEFRKWNFGYYDMTLKLDDMCEHNITIRNTDIKMILHKCIAVNIYDYKDEQKARLEFMSKVDVFSEYTLDYIKNICIMFLETFEKFKSMIVQIIQKCQKTCEFLINTNTGLKYLLENEMVELRYSRFVKDCIFTLTGLDKLRDYYIWEDGRGKILEKEDEEILEDDINNNSIDIDNLVDVIRIEVVLDLSFCDIKRLKQIRGMLRREERLLNKILENIDEKIKDLK